MLLFVSIPLLGLLIIGMRGRKTCKVSFDFLSLCTNHLRSHHSPCVYSQEVLESTLNSESEEV